MKSLNIFLAAIFVCMFVSTGCGKTENTSNTTSSGTRTTTTNTSQQTQTQNTQTQTKDTAVKDTVKKEEKKVDDNKSADDVVNMKTSMGNIKIKLYTDRAPITAGNFKSLVEEGFYDGIIFHRVIDGFMIQGGDPTGTGTGGSGKKIPDEFAPGLKHDKKGMLSMANAGPNTGTSQFFITLAPTAWLDGKHAIFGEVIEGMDIVEKIGKTKTGPGDKPVTEVKMIKVTMDD
jgi:cyclophilin family peptidyl-prolyl cis-trans isomerase